PDVRLGTLLEGPLLSHYHLGHCFFGHVPHRPVARYPAFRRDRELLKPPAPALSQRALPLLRQSQELHRVPLAALSLTVHFTLKRLHYNLHILVGHLHIRDAWIVRGGERLPRLGRPDGDPGVRPRDALRAGPRPAARPV